MVADDQGCAINPARNRALDAQHEYGGYRSCKGPVQSQFAHSRESQDEDRVGVLMTTISTGLEQPDPNLIFIEVDGETVEQVLMNQGFTDESENLIMHQSPREEPEQIQAF